MHMQRNRVLIVTVCLAVFAGWLVIDLDRLFADTYYVKIPKVETAERDGTDYVYTTIGYDEERKKRSLTFTSDSRLAEGDFLQLYVKDEGTVTSYEIADERDVPFELKMEQAGEAGT
ncbi:YxeA family protein [Exiguobacterium sp. SH1S4]|nr:YxeA family protein [Exiguobacterium sp. SH5S32]TCI55297.1 YxeA family protein [Exiguobacterium sp. SH1S4]TCI75089.1 YxeA family protein [Exiguobacterium sp. SH1S1]TCI78018.1 YxeA family protein [Exiguobacterium sp. SH0S1]